MSTRKIKPTDVRKLKLELRADEVPEKPAMFTISRRVLPPHFCRQTPDELVAAVMTARALDLSEQVVCFSNWPHKQTGTAGRMFRSRCNGVGETIDVTYRRPGVTNYVPQFKWKAHSKQMNRWHCLVLKRRPDKWGRDRDGVHVFWVAENRQQITIIEGTPNGYVGAKRMMKLNRNHYRMICRKLLRHIYEQILDPKFDNKKVLPGVPRKDPSWRTA